MSLSIKNVILPSNIILAPMAGYSDPAFRLLCSGYGAGLTCTEMISAKGLHYKNKKTEDLLISLDGESPKAVQIFGHEPEIMAEAVQSELLSKFDIIDINMGCPAKKIISNGDGSALLKDKELARRIIEACSRATDKPITVKFRLGFDDADGCVEFAKMCEEAGAAAITVHGRTTKQGYSGEVDYEAISRIVRAVKIPVFANGDCRTVEDAKKILDLTNATGIMIGRAALGNAKIFSEMAALDGETFAVKNLKGVNLPAVDDIFSQIKFHYTSLAEFFPERAVVLQMRAFLPYYLSGKFKNSKLLVELLKEEKMLNVLEKLANFFENS